jgi:hypothetical protein
MMERRKALALAAAGTLALGTAVVAFAAAAGSFLGFGGSHDGVGSFAGTLASASEKPATQVRTRHRYDQYVVDAPTGSSPSTAHANAPREDARSSMSDAPDAPTPDSREASASDAAPARDVELETPGRDDDASAATPPTTSRFTPTTRPPGVPDDWPANKPIPPMPPNCRQPQLEDNGQWNCQDAEEHDD